MTPEELKWWTFQERLKEIRAIVEKPMWGCQWKNDQDFQGFMTKVLKPLASEDLNP